MNVPLPVLALVVAGASASVLLPVFLVRSWRSQARQLRAERARVSALFQASVEVQASAELGDVEAAICRGARALLGDVDARVDRIPPGPAELAVRLRSAFDPDRWLVVRPRSTAPALGPDDQRAIELLVAATAAAQDNAMFHARITAERQRLADLVGSSSDGIFSLDAEGAITLWNPAMSRITRLPSDRAVGRPCDEVFIPLDGDGAAMPHDVWLERLDVDERPLEVTISGGEQRWLDCVASPLPGSGVVVVARDISAQREVDQLKADFLATVSHELRTPLTPIQGFLQTLLHEDANFDEADRRRFYELMLRQSNRLERLIRDLLDATSLQDRAHLFVPERLDWVATATRVIELFRGQDATRTFELWIDDSMPFVVADEQRAEQVLSNLISNAAKYSPAGTSVEVQLTREDDQIRTTVVDHGPGIPLEERDWVFDRFTRLGNHLTRRVGGAGLGLFIARKLVEGMGGTIEVDDAPNGGAAFSFTLPLASASPAETVHAELGVGVN